MRVIVVGGGTVGVEICTKLAEKEHDVVLIEKDPQKLDKIAKNVDAMLIEGDGVSLSTLKKAGVEEAGLLIAVTEVDEVNMIASMMAKRCGVKKTVARIRNPEYTDETMSFTNDQLGIDIIINPERVAALEIAKIIKAPNVKGIEYFSGGKVQMVGLTVEEESPIANSRIKNIKFPSDSNVVAIVRNNQEVVIPGGEDMIYPGDVIYLLGEKGLLASLGTLTRHPDKKAENIMVIGGGRIGLELCKLLEGVKKHGFHVKLVEKDAKRCAFLTEELNKTLVLNGDGTNLKFLQEEDLEDVDVVVSVTGDDKTNLLSSVMSDRLGVSKTIVEIIKSDYEAVLDTMKVNAAISPRLLTAAQILKLTIESDVISMTILGNYKAEILELNVPADAPIVNKKLAKAKLPKGILVGAIVRKGRVITPGGQDSILPDDRIILFSMEECSNKVSKYFGGTKKTVI
ncbi:Trk system potassium transporter TrkA [Natranaerofaba carboxydovora]|uniref:Trk system potassium transporter TrkA n=1 Tax=Natranaerofaba carboxydovora TaxID=2742683 RepID=UPI001F12ECF1|nr:Trk system potassium transporter TrkA [Natranaerofaba carboxydovora]UMZ74002.1 Trk system potassium uptake protein TrkA [Natranaerofaba carboxydovora]